MHWTESATLLVIVVLGGLGRRWGAPLGVAIWLTLAEVLKIHTEYWRWPMGLLLILIVFFAPRGIAALVEGRGKSA
jgi:branched-chain amino acid transport system permease protein